jgi:hypothetical protein
MIKEFYAIQKFQKISEALDLNLELMELKMKKDMPYHKAGELHIRTKLQEKTGDFTVVKSFKDFKEFNIFLENFQKELNKFAKYTINPELFYLKRKP